MNHCDYGHETVGEVKILPYGECRKHHGNLILCRDHYECEITARRENVKEGIPEHLPRWKKLKKYKNGNG